jgi:hypothetical protein
VVPAELEKPSPAPPEPARPALPPLRRGERTLIVGVDFGTSSTKVIWQDLSDNHFEVFNWSPSEQGLAALLLPSAITIRDGAIHFGLSDRETLEGDIRLPSIKLCVLCRSNPAICRCGSSVARRGIVRLPELETAYPASVFACLFLAHVFREVERGLEHRFPDDDLLLIWNVGCPMDYLDEKNRRHDWETMAGTAMGLRRQVSNPAGVSLLAEAAARLDRFAVLSEGERNYFVQPEGLAAVKAFLESPHAESKTYAIVDVGAGTTEVSFFFNGHVMTEVGRPLRPSYLADTTAAVGGGKIDVELGREWRCAVEEARRRKETGAHACPRVSSIDEICSQYRRTCSAILRNHLLAAPNDMRFDLFVIGGGARLSILKSALHNFQLPGGFVLEGRHGLLPPRALRNWQGFERDWDMLANACGLASSLYWDYYPVAAANPIPPRPIRQRLDRDTLYPA